MDWLLEPWAISLIIVIFVLGNLATLKYLGKSNLLPGQRKKDKSDLDKLLEIYREKEDPKNSENQTTHAKETESKDK